MKILVGYNGYYVSKDAVQLAISRAKILGASVHVVTKLEKGHRLHLDDMEKADKALEEIKAICEKENIPCETTLLANQISAGENLIKMAQDEAADLIIIGVKRRSKVSKLILGSTAMHVILNAPCPVLSIK